MKVMGSKKFYENSPKLERGADGKMGVQKKHQSEANTEDPSAGHEGEPVHVKEESGEEAHDMHSRHNLERHMLHSRHEHEHHVHEKKGGHKMELHAKHAKEHGDMLKAHDKEMAGINENEGAEPGAGA